MTGEWVCGLFHCHHLTSSRRFCRCKMQSNYINYEHIQPFHHVNLWWTLYFLPQCQLWAGNVYCESVKLLQKRRAERLAQQETFLCITWKSWNCNFNSITAIQSGFLNKIIEKMNFPVIITSSVLSLSCRFSCQRISGIEAATSLGEPQSTRLSHLFSFTSI